jgi:hypothetical protein
LMYPLTGRLTNDQQPCRGFPAHDRARPEWQISRARLAGADLGKQLPQIFFSRRRLPLLFKPNPIQRSLDPLHYTTQGCSRANRQVRHFCFPEMLVPI